MNNHLVRDSLGWGFCIWFVGYGLGILLFTLVPPSLIGWIIFPIGTAFALWILFKQIQSTSPWYDLFLGVTWTSIAIFADYFFLVKAFMPEDGYYKLDVYIYYAVTFVLPILIGSIKRYQGGSSTLKS